MTGALKAILCGIAILVVYLAILLGTVSYINSPKVVNEDIDSVMNGQVSSIVMGKKGMEEAKDIQSVRYIAPIIPGGHIRGYYRVTKANLKKVDDSVYPIREGDYCL